MTNILSDNVIPTIKSSVSSSIIKTLHDPPYTRTSSGQITNIDVSAAGNAMTAGVYFEINPAGSSYTSTITSATTIKYNGQNYPLYVFNPYSSTGHSAISGSMVIYHDARYELRFSVDPNTNRSCFILMNRSNNLTSSAITFSPIVEDYTVFHDNNDNDYSSMKIYRFPDGTQIVAGTSYFYEINVNAGWGALYQGTLNRAMPITRPGRAFIEAPHVTVSCHSIQSFGAVWLCASNDYRGPSTTEISAGAYNVVKPTSVTNVGIGLDFTAVGSWK